MGGMVQRSFEVFRVALRLGLTSFGGPLAHLAYFHQEYVVRRKWIGEADYAALVALCQVLPGPTSSQVGMGIGRLRAGRWGAVAAWLGFTLPSSLLMLSAALWFSQGSLPSGVVRGLEWTAWVVVAHATFALARTFTTNLPMALVAGGAALLLAWFPSSMMTVLVLAAAALFGTVRWKVTNPVAPPARKKERTRFPWTPVLAGAAFTVVLPLLASLHPLVAVADTFFRAGSLVFGGGHVVLPVLASDLLGQDSVSSATLTQAYGWSQIVPGPLFSIATFLGEAMAGPAGALVATFAIFLPSFLLLEALWPWWGQWQQRPWVASVLAPVHASVVGLLAASLVRPLGLQAFHGPVDLVIVLGLWALLHGARTPGWVIVAVASSAGLVLQWLIPGSATLP